MPSANTCGTAGIAFGSIGAVMISTGITPQSHAVSDVLYVSTGSAVFVLEAGEDVWQPLAEGCDTTASGLALMEEADRRYLVIATEHSIKRHTL